MNVYWKAEFFAGVADPGGQMCYPEVNATHIKVDEVGAIRLVQVVIAVEEVDAGGYYQGLKECRRTGFKGKGRRWEELEATYCG